MQRLSSRFTRLTRLPRHSPHILPPPHLHTPSHTHSHIRIPNRYLTACSYAQSPASARHGHATPGHGHVYRVHSRYLTARAYAQSPASSSPSPSPGLFMVPGLQQPEDFNVLANRAIENCDKLQEALAEPCSLTPQQTLEVLDQISNEVCTVIDAAELCRNVHHCEHFRTAAEEAFATLSLYINTLNSNMRIFTSLHDIVYGGKDVRVRAGLTAEEEILAIDMLHELETEGVHVQDASAKKKLAALQNKIVTLESQYMQNISICSGSIGETYKLGPLSPQQHHNITHWLASQGIAQDPHHTAEMYVTMCTNPRVSSMLLRVLDKEELRELVWRKSHSQPAANKIILGKLVIARQRLSRQLSFDSFAHKSLSRKVIKSPQHVQDLLLETARCVAHQGETETDLLKSVKSSLQESSAVHVAVAGGKRSATASGGVSGTRSSRKVNNRIYTGKRYSKQTSDLNSTEELDSVSVFPWDESFLINSYKSITSADKAPSSHSHSHSKEELGEYLSVSSCMNGLRYVCASVFGIEMKTEQVSSVESWTGSGDREFDLVKCSFSGPNGESLGYIYFDLFARPNKFTGAAHFTVTCGCTNTLAVSKNNIQGLQSSDEQQLPVVALVFNFPRDANLSMQALETFYHEVGHAMHSLLSRTKFQHLSGTRGSTDFVEVPSHLFEHFARDPQVVRSWARKESDLQFMADAKQIPAGDPPPLNLIEEALVNRQEFAAIELQTQLLYALVDQYAFGPDIIRDFEERVAQNAKDESRVDQKAAVVICDLLDEYVEGISRDLAFCPTVNVNLLPHTHLVNYGGAYYSYLFAKMHAAQIWQNQFSEDPLSRQAGDKLWMDMLQFGASRNPAKMLEKLGNGGLDPAFYLNEI